MFKSKAQQAKIAQLEKEGKVKKGTTEAWAKETKNIKDLPKRVGQAKSIDDLHTRYKKKFGVK